MLCESLIIWWMACLDLFVARLTDRADIMRGLACLSLIIMFLLTKVNLAFFLPNYVCLLFFFVFLLYLAWS